MMEPFAARRKLNTYGKAARKILVHDLFDIGTLQPGERTQQASTSSSTEDLPEQPFHNVIFQSRSDNSTGKTKEHTPVEAITRRTNVALRATGPSSRAPAEGSGLSLFDIQSSDEDSYKVPRRQPVKKRALAPAVSDTLGALPSQRQDNKTAVNSGLKENTRRLKGPRSLAQTKEAGNMPTKTSTATATAESSNVKTQPRKSKKDSGALMAREEGNIAGGPIHPDTIVPSKVSRRTTSPLRVSSGSSAHLSDGSHPSHPSRQSTPKRKRDVLDEDFDNSPSPSALPMKSLKLTSEINSQQFYALSDDEDVASPPFEIPAPRTGRTRLIDRLDAPPPQSMDKAVPSSQASSGDVSNSPKRRPVGGTTSPPKSHTGKPEIAPSLPNAGASGRQRATYARQRSHLAADMLDGLDSLSQPSSQQSFSQLGSFSALASQMELANEDSDEAEGSGQIKSIHELRRGGVMRKFDLDLHTILEDVESDSKSLRIQGLLQLTQKLEDLTFLRHFQDSSALSRLMECVTEALDRVSAIMVMMILQSIISAQQASPRILSQILNTLYRVPSTLISETRTLSKVAQDRSQNLSKLLIRDIKDLDEQRSKRNGEAISPASQLVLTSIDGALRGLINLKEPVAKMPRRLLGEVLSAFTRTQDDTLEGSEMDRLERMQLLLSILEIACANSELTSSSLSTSRITTLGETVAGVMTIARKARPPLEHSCLRLIVSLSNNEPKVCEAFTEGSLIATVFQVVDDHFLTLAALAAKEQEFDHAQLESVILAVGCLLNLAECAEVAREKMLAVVPGEKSLIHRLVAIFNSHVDQTSEALTIEQTQILVAFGYTSALLCTLCLNQRCYDQISTSIKGEGLSLLFGAADTFLAHLQTVEASLAEDGASSPGFTTRFTAVLDTVRRQAI